MRRGAALLIALAVLAPAAASAVGGGGVAAAKERFGKIARPVPGSVDAGRGGSTLDCVAPTVLTHGVTISDSTVGGTNNQATYGCFSPTLEWNGGEEVYTFSTTQVSDIRVSLTDISGGDVDLFILNTCDANDCWDWGDETVVYLDAPAGSYTIVVDGWQTDSADYDITAWSATGMLLVDDDNSLNGDTDVSTSYRSALDNLGRSYTWWPSDLLGTPTASDMSGYRHVVWFTGEDDSPGLVVSGAEESVMAAYLDAGGKLILVSQEYLRDVSGGVDGKLDDGAFAFNYLQARSVDNDLTGEQTSMSGAAGDPIGDDGRLDTGTNTLAVSTTTPIGNSATGMGTLFGETVYRTTGGAATVLRYDNFAAADFFRVVFASFPVENVTSAAPDDLETFLDRSLAWIDQQFFAAVARGAGVDDAVTGNSSGLPDPGETVELDFLVENNDAGSHDAEAYLVVQNACVTPVIETLDLGSVLGGGTQVSGKFRVDIDGACAIGQRITFTVNLWIDGTWYDTSGWGFFVGQADTLLVKDEQLHPNSDGIIPYELALQEAGISYALHDNAQFESPPYQDVSLLTNLVMDSYQHVIWMTGPDFFSTVTLDDEAELAGLLDGGGKLLLSSQDYFWDVFGGDGCNPACASLPGDFAYDYLGVSTVEQDVVSRVDSPLAGMSVEELSDDLSFNLQTDLSISNETDRITATSLANARPLFEYSAGSTSGLIYEGQSVAAASTYRAISLLFPFENLADGDFPSTRTQTLRRIYYWMDFGDTTTNTLGGPNTYYYPNEPTQLSADRGGPPSFEAQLSWTSVTTNTNGDPIEIVYHVYSGFDPTALELDPTEYQLNSTTDGRIPAPGETIYYKVRAADLLGIESQGP